MNPGGTAGDAGGTAGAGGTRGAGGAGAASAGGTAGAGGTGGAGGAGAASAGGAAGAGSATGAGGAGAASAGGTVGGAGGAGGAGAASARGAAGAGGTAGGVGGASTGGTGAASAGDAGAAGAGGTRVAAGDGGAGPAGGLRHILDLLPAPTEFLVASTTPADLSQPQLLPHSPLPNPVPYTAVTESAHQEPETRASTPERREPETRASVPARVRRVRRPHAPAEELDCLAAAAPHLATMLLAPKGDPDALDIPNLHSYREVISVEYSSHWQTAMDAEMASWKSTGTYVDEVPPPGANIVSGMWIFRVKRPLGSPPAFKARYVARGFNHERGSTSFKSCPPPQR
ncbi:unnamed protein product [Closterium sp. Naga37s-1]|nr:unnamed protein product [Closterium sp. Naga37s-1]